jgi:pyridoxamine 5'-phosphate oxidase
VNRNEILSFLNANPGCHLATVEGDQPRVRGMFMFRADAQGIIFHTGAFKSLYSQLRGNKKVEICFNSPDTQVRIAGAVEILYDASLKKEILEARPWLKPLMGQKGEDALVIFRITGCKVAVWTMEANLEPTAYVSL